MTGKTDTTDKLAELTDVTDMHVLIKLTCMANKTHKYSNKLDGLMRVIWLIRLIRII